MKGYSIPNSSELHTLLVTMSSVHFHTFVEETTFSFAPFLSFSSFIKTSEYPKFLKQRVDDERSSEAFKVLDLLYFLLINYIAYIKTV